MYNRCLRFTVHSILFRVPVRKSRKTSLFHVTVWTIGFRLIICICSYNIIHRILRISSLPKFLILNQDASCLISSLSQIVHIFFFLNNKCIISFTVIYTFVVKFLQYRVRLSVSSPSVIWTIIVQSFSYVF